ncbi:MAG TPA: phenylacetate--CoA ligase family protein [Patescibacteria group bacterium]|nr:phenylacetate--CoA ligase family protein [Patescibacteria group bacterium]
MTEIADQSRPTGIRVVARHAGAWLIGLGRGAWLFPLDVIFKTVGLRYGWLTQLFKRTPPRLLAGLGQLRAERASWRAAKRVPAYRDFLEQAAVDPDDLFPFGILGRLPETDKRNYIDRYGLMERCVGGGVPYPGTTIDESSGSTGTPYNWIRGRREREVAHRNISFFARYAFGEGPLVTLNAFSMGAWAAGMNMSLGMTRHGIVKSIGPDIDKLLSTLTYLGPSYRFLISGYPPFLKHLLDEGARRGFPWDRYEVHGLVGGEGMTEELRDVLLERFRSVYSGYGATDIEIGMAAESPVSVALRRLARRRPDVREALFGDDPRLPMVFQYNPLIHFLEVNELGEIICTVSRLDLLSPRIRYNVHDEGGLLGFATARERLAAFGFDIERLGERDETAGPRGPLPWSRPIPLPFLWVNGRRDATISVMGANIYPEDIETVVYRDPTLVPRLHSFLLSTVDDERGVPRPMVALELADMAGVDDRWRATMADQLRDGLTGLNIDYRSSIAEFPDAMQPIVATYGLGEGPFAADAKRIKQRRIIRPTS